MSVIDDLIALQDQDALVRDLEREAKDIPGRKDQELLRLAKPAERLRDAKAAFENGKENISISEEKVQQKAQQIKDLESTKSSLRTNKEFEDVNTNLNYLREDLNRLEADALSLAQQQEAHAVVLAEAQKVYDETAEGIKDYCASLDERLAEVEKELAEALDVRAKLRAPLDVPASRGLLMSYERLAKNKWPALVPVSSDRICQGCHMELTASKLQDVVRAQRAVICEYCGRLLYKM